MAQATTARSRPPIEIDHPPRTALESLDRETLSAMLEAGKEVLECYRVLKKTGDNIVGELLRNAGTFYQWQHYPKGDVYDRDNGSQFYYHAHPKSSRPGEHGHFHTFLRASGMPRGIEPVPYGGDAVWPLGADSLSHLVAISMDKKGFPTGLFTVNRWVTGDAWYKAQDVSAMVDRFVIDHAQPSWPVNRWITGMVGLYRPLVKDLVRERDAVVAAWREAHPDQDVFEDKNLEITSVADITVERQIVRLRALLA
ncbi:MAG: hypothetical protein O3B22_15555 [Proteobacteria bacterium]|nr:hypothetical protein [Pseudomonadota bacterium]